MIKKIIIAVMASAVILTSTACSSLLSTTNTYLKALDTTQKADSYQSRTEIAVKLDLAGSSDKMKKDLEKYREMKFNIDESIDSRDKKAQVDSLFSTGDFLMNSRIYVDGDQAFMKSMMTGDKYMLLTPQMDEKKLEEMKKTSAGYSKLFKDAATIWKASIEKEILAKMGDTIVYTPDGDIKVTQLSLELTDDKSKDILAKLAKAVSGNEKVKESMIESGLENKPDNVPEANIRKGINDFFDSMSAKTEELKDRYTLNKLKLTAKIDKDSYIIDQVVECDLILKMKDGEVGIKLTANTTRWNFNNGIEINIPKIADKDIMKPEEMNKDSKYVKNIEKLFKN